MPTERTSRSFRAGSLPAVACLLFALGCGGGASDDASTAGRVGEAAQGASAEPAADSVPARSAVLSYGKVFPKDEGPNDAGFLAFRDTLLAIIARRDTAALLAVVDSNVKSSFGGDEGIVNFREFWELSSPTSRLWSTLEDVLRHGGSFEGDSDFVAPYTFHALPDSLDAFTTLIVRDSAVRVHARRDEASATLALLSYDLIPAADDLEPDTLWVAVALHDGGAGYIRAEQVRSPIDHRAFFTRRDGRWWLVMLLAGD